MFGFMLDVLYVVQVLFNYVFFEVINMIAEELRMFES